MISNRTVARLAWALRTLSVALGALSLLLLVLNSASAKIPMDGLFGGLAAGGAMAIYVIIWGMASGREPGAAGRDDGGAAGGRLAAGRDPNAALRDCPRDLRRGAGVSDRADRRAKRVTM